MSDFNDAIQKVLELLNSNPNVTPDLAQLYTRISEWAAARGLPPTVTAAPASATTSATTSAAPAAAAPAVATPTAAAPAPATTSAPATTATAAAPTAARRKTPTTVSLLEKVTLNSINEAINVLQHRPPINDIPFIPFTTFESNVLDLNHFLRIQEVERRTNLSAFALSIHRAVYAMYYVRHLDLLRQREPANFQMIHEQLKGTASHNRLLRLGNRFRGLVVQFGPSILAILS